jgi:hypothetical protein
LLGETNGLLLKYDDTLEDFDGFGLFDGTVNADLVTAVGETLDL